MLNPKLLKEVKNSSSSVNLANDDKVGNIFLNMDTFKSKLSYSISEIEILKANNENNINSVSNSVIKNEDNMKDELKSFLNSLSSSDANKRNGNIDSFDYGGSSFSAF